MPYNMALISMAWSFRAYVGESTLVSRRKDGQTYQLNLAELVNNIILNST